MTSIFEHKHTVRYLEEIPAGEDGLLLATTKAFQDAVQANPGWTGYNMIVDVDERLDGTTKLKITLMSPEHPVPKTTSIARKVFRAAAWAYILIWCTITLIPWEKLP